VDFDLDTFAFFDRSQSFNLFKMIVSFVRATRVFERLHLAAMTAEQTSAEGSEALSSFGLPSGIMKQKMASREWDGNFRDGLSHMRMEQRKRSDRATPRAAK